MSQPSYLLASSQLVAELDDPLKAVVLAKALLAAPGPHPPPAHDAEGWGGLIVAARDGHDDVVRSRPDSEHALLYTPQGKQKKPSGALPQAT